MSPSVDLSPETFARLQQHAVPLVDNLESVISRLADYYESRNGSPWPPRTASPASHNLNASSAPSGGSLPTVRLFTAISPPDLKHTKVLTIEFCGKALDHSQTNWNALLYAAIREARKRTRSNAEFNQIVSVNTTQGEKNDEGYRFLPDIGISVQGQDANSAWRATCTIAQKLDCPLSVTFMWRQKDGAAFPGVSGRFSVPS